MATCTDDVKLFCDGATNCPTNANHICNNV